MDAMRDVLKSALGRGLRSLQEEDRLAAAWVVACGRTMAEHGRVVGYSAGMVEVEASAGAWLEHMKAMRAELATELARIAGVPVTGIHFVMKR
jgi:predicted nucleic acid-binding Zn ribbon protein